ncbi:single-stranded DNA-binding protein [Acinetobacter johnsonii]|nr:single-stranded DNA-binding protein [Acinetobacter johnsonii]
MHRITTSNRLAKIAGKYLKKGGNVYIEGSLGTRKWKDQTGNEKEVAKIKADMLQSLSDLIFVILTRSFLLLLSCYKGKSI